MSWVDAWSRGTVAKDVGSVVTGLVVVGSVVGTVVWREVWGRGRASQGVAGRGRWVPRLDRVGTGRDVGPDAGRVGLGSVDGVEGRRC